MEQTQQVDLLIAYPVYLIEYWIIDFMSAREEKFKNSGLSLIVVCRISPRSGQVVLTRSAFRKLQQN